MARRKEKTVRHEDITGTPTIYMALDLGRRRRMVGFLLPGDRRARLQRIDGGDREKLGQRIAHQRAQVDDPRARVVSCYEAGRDGFWLDRWLKHRGVENRVLDPASIEVA